MEFLVELFFEIFIGGPIEGFYKSKRIKPWVKNLVSGLFWTALEVLLIAVSVGIIRAGNPWPMCLMCVGVTLIWTRVGGHMWKHRHR